MNKTTQNKTSLIHPTAQIDPNAKLHSSVKIGAFCVVGPDVQLDANVTLDSHVVVTGNTMIGKETHIFPFSVIGSIPQDLKYKGEKSSLIIGQRNQIREHVTIHPGTQAGRWKTEIGNDGLFMVGVHIAHDCVVGNNVIMANNAALGGHVHVDDLAIIGGFAGIKQFMHIGEGAMVGGMTPIDRDLTPYSLAMGERGENLRGLNITGLKRSGYPREQIKQLNKVFHCIFKNKNKSINEAVHDVIDSDLYNDNPLVQKFISFLDTPTQRGFISMPR